jgi:hypothetical protein
VQLLRALSRPSFVGALVVLLVAFFGLRAMAQQQPGTFALMFGLGPAPSKNLPIACNTDLDGVRCDQVVSVAPVGNGGMQPIPGGSTNGTAIGTCATPSQGVEMYIPASKSLTYTIATSAPGSAPSATVTYTNPASALPVVVQENLANGAQIYVTQPVSPDSSLVFRCI